MKPFLKERKQKKLKKQDKEMERKNKEVNNTYKRK